MDNRVAYIELFGVTMSGVTKPDQGLYWTDLVGWWGLPDLRGETDNIPGGHGRFPRLKYLRDSRAITLTGHILTKDNEDLVATRDRLEAALSAGYGTMRVMTWSTGAWDREVEIDTLTIEPDHGRSYTKFTVDMVAPDPRRYGQPRTVGPATLPVLSGGVRLPQRMPWNFGKVVSGSTLAIANSGSIPLMPVLRVAEGNAGAVTVVELNTGNTLSLAWPLDYGSQLIFDSDARKVTLGPQELTRWLVSRQWFEIPPGETYEYRFEVASSTISPVMYGDFKIGAW